MKSTTITPLALATKWFHEARKNQSPLYRYDVTSTEMAQEELEGILARMGYSKGEQYDF